ncbi:MAG: hypothetical protein ABIP62_12855 [Vicinamibacteria bacterium]
MTTENALSQRAMDALRPLVDAYRISCLWSLRRDFYPETLEEAKGVLDAIERHGDRSAFMRSAEIRAWLLPNSSATSVAS